MIIGANKDLVIENIKKNVLAENYNSKVEVDDPNLSSKEKVKIIKHFLRVRRTLCYHFCCLIARTFVNIVTEKVNKDTEIVGIENIQEIKGGAIITSNHFNPLDTTVIRTMTRKLGRNKFYIVSQESNLAMKGFLGFFMKHTDVIPISTEKTYISKYFPKLLREKLIRRQFILIYPEQEMWFNYRKPRPPKRGAYYYAAKNNVPIISCFTEIVDLPEKETEEFYATKCILHVLKPIFPDSQKSVRENSLAMMEQDYAQKVQAYEEAYRKTLDYTFGEEDIAGWVGCKEKSNTN